MRNRELVNGLLALAAILLTGTGAYLIYPPAGLVVAGLMVWWDLLSSRVRKFP
jgi:hypothetical protein